MNIINAIYNLVNHPVTEVVSHYTGRNRANNAGDALEEYVKDLFADSFRLTDRERMERMSEVFSYFGNSSNPPDAMLRGGDAIEIKKIESKNVDLLLEPTRIDKNISVNRENAELVENFFRQDKPVAAIRHGGAALLAAKNISGRSILDGRRVTGASDDEERQLALDRVVPFSLGKRLRNCGAEYVCLDPWEPHVIADGMLITGQNTQSTGRLASAMLSAMESAPDGGA